MSMQFGKTAASQAITEEEEGWKARETLAKKEGLLRVTIAETGSYGQRLEAAHINLKAYGTTVPQLEAEHIEEKQKNANYADLETKRLELKQKMADQQKIHDALVQDLRNQIRELGEENVRVEVNALKGAKDLVKEEKKVLRKEFEDDMLKLEQKIDRLEVQRHDTDHYIAGIEANAAAEERKNEEKESRIRGLEKDILKLKTKQLKHEGELKEAVNHGNAIAAENVRLETELEQARQITTDLIKDHKQTVSRLERQLAVQESQYKTLVVDSKGARDQIAEVEKILDEKKVKIEALVTQLQDANVEFVGGGGGVPQKTLDQYIDMVRGLTGQVQAIHGSRKPQFSRDVDAYRSEGGDEKREAPELASSSSSSSSTTTTSSPSSETESTHGEEEEEEEEVPADVQVIYRARRGRGGPIQHVHHEVPIEGPTIYLTTPGENIPGPIRYTPFRVFAHNPITCWLLVEFNFLVLFFHWIKRLLSLSSWIPRIILGGGNSTPPSPDYVSSSSDTDSDADGPQRPQPGVFSTLFKPKPGRIPSARNTLWGLAFHICVYSTLWLSFSVWQERELWLAENDGTRRWLMARRGSNGFLDMNQMLPQRVNRQLDILRYDFMELVGIPLTYQSPG
ncbi:hypothetical protein DSL72_009113 [Monilinia vaccinii-corymbosi]|uniref:Uncharacterized protein n=1 Tax=Monilinia vaccinii-corymbosi TaxID=61207 RepID=A0A8A3PQ87_9HELO|nr:hypothetical protein DSL72_009113 [Monilinia vaccinii-corymbosi]